MSNTIIDQDYPYDILHRGSKDASRHNKRVQEAVRKQLKDIIGQQDIITGDGNKKVKVRLKHLNQYRFVHSRDYVDVVGRDEFDELEEGEVLQRPGSGGGDPLTAGDAIGDAVYEAEYTIEELTDIMMSELQLPDLDERKKNEIVSEIVEWTDIRKESGIQSLIDKKRTLLANIKRKSKIKKLDRKKPLPIINDDLRFRTYNIIQEKHSNAVVLLCMDRSSSMWRDKIYAVKALYFWIVQFLKRRYNKVEIRFIAHDYDARELTEKEFFTISDSGGTRVSAAYEMCEGLIKQEYPASKWNIYAFHSSDGDTWSDEELCMEIVDRITNKLGANLFAYTEINIDSYRQGSSLLLDCFEDKMRNNSKILVSVINEISDVMDAIRTFLRHSVKEA
ncbi:hypothetical protein LCGC14_1714470 [marine sediment metagenome]|uniref:VWFA domain-containing protein n=1 Tax=marine sediment metagenome TaxID=412755 RepID=A0A0F9JUT1_9ZZZZ